MTKISAQVVADSTDKFGNRLTTLLVTMPRYILAEFNTHRMLSKNSASSRAIPFKKMVDSVRSSPFIPVAWMRDHSGMQGSAYFEDPKDIEAIETDWLVGMKAAVQHVESMNMRGLTKQLCNRPLEAYMYHTVLVSGTEWENFFALRCPQYFIGNQPDQCYRSWSDLSDVCGLNPFLDLKKEKDGSALPEDIREQDILYRMKHNKGQADIHMMLTAEVIELR